MQIISPTKLKTQARQRGFALILTLIMLGVVLLVFASILSWAYSNAIMTARNNQYNMSVNAAESAVELVVGRIDRDFIYSTITNTSSAYASLPAQIIDQSGWPIQYGFSSTNGSTGTVDVVFAPQNDVIQPLNSQYAGLNGQFQGLDVYATATPIGQRYTVPATVHESVQFANIPLYQFAIFYNLNLEISPGGTMLIKGPVFCNASIWEGSSSLTFNSTVTAVGTNYPQAADPFALNYSGTTPPTFAGGAPVNNANALVMPIGTNNNPQSVLAMLNLPPVDYAMGTAAAYSSNGMKYPANGADLVISNFYNGTNDGALRPAGTNLIVYYQDSALMPQPLPPLPYDFYTIQYVKNGVTSYSNVNYVSASMLGTNAAKTMSTNIYYAGFTWVTNVAFYDWREGWNGGSGPAKRVEAVQIDMGLLNTWLNNTLVTNSGYSSDQLKLLHTGNHIASAYVYTSVPLTSSQLPAVRVTDGAILPHPGGSTRGFSVATPFPMYVWKDYNCQDTSGSSLTTSVTTHTYPASLMADAITILSDSWVDYNSSAATLKSPTAGTTTVNAAMLEGIVQTDPTISGDYSGGAENFLRLLEGWSGTTLTYNGSIVVLFNSQYATNHWRNPGNYYSVPTRNWSFDTNFNYAVKLPPLMPDIRAMIRGSWSTHQ